jgi:hypothetical protein
MKAAKLVLILIVTMGLILFVRGGRDFNLVKSLPFCGGHKPGFYDFGAIALVVLMLWGLGRLKQSGQEQVRDHQMVEAEEVESDAEADSDDPGTKDDEEQQPV